jgi:hypothetical protein
MGIASNNPVSVRAIGFTTIAHQMHHQKYFKKGIYKLFSKQVDQIFYFVFERHCIGGLVEGIT